MQPCSIPSLCLPCLRCRRKRTRSARHGPRVRQHYSSAKKMAIMKYADLHGIRAAAREFRLRGPSCICDWESHRAEIEQQATVKVFPSIRCLSIAHFRRGNKPSCLRLPKLQGSIATLHKGKETSYTKLESNLFHWMQRRRARSICITKGMMLAKAKEMDARYYPTAR